MKAVSAKHLSGLTGPLNAQDYVFRLLMARAAGKLDGAEPESLARTASWALRDAGKWTDDIRIDLTLKKPIKLREKCVRLLHGVPSPRLWRGYTPYNPRMTAKDAIYFFQPHEPDRQVTLQSIIPDLGTEAELADWLTSFSSTRFEKQLVQALIASQDERANQVMARLGQPAAFKRIAWVGAEIDRMAWFTGQRSMTLANAAPVWRPAKV